MFIYLYSIAALGIDVKLSVLIGVTQQQISNALPQIDMCLSNCRR